MRVAAEDILYFEADQKYVTVFHTHGEVLIEESLNQLEQDFAPWFLRIHRKLLVAARHVLSIERVPEGGDEHHRLYLRDVDKPLLVSRRKLAEVRRAIERAAQ